MPRVVINSKDKGSKDKGSRKKNRTSREADNATAPRNDFETSHKRYTSKDPKHP